MGHADTDAQRRSSPVTNFGKLATFGSICNVMALKQTYFQEYPESAVCVQHSIDSRNSAIHSAYRILLRPSSLSEPRDPSLKVVKKYKLLQSNGIS